MSRFGAQDTTVVAARPGDGLPAHGPVRVAPRRHCRRRRGRPFQIAGRPAPDGADAIVELVDGARPVRARAATGDERARLWAYWRELGQRSGEAMIANCDAYAARLLRQPAVVVLEPVGSPADDRPDNVAPRSPTPSGEAES